MGTCGNSADIICKLFTHVVQPILLVLLAIAAIWFVMGVLQFISGAKIEERREKGLRHIDQGVIGLVIMFSVFGIISMIANTLDAGKGDVDDPTDAYDAFPSIVE